MDNDCYDCDGSGVLTLPMTDREVVLARRLMRDDPSYDGVTFDIKGGYKTRQCSFCGGSGINVSE